MAKISRLNSSSSNRSARLAMLMSFVMMACDDKEAPLDEGAENPHTRDPWGNLPNQDSPSGSDTGTDEVDDLLDIPDPDISEISVCYFGPDRDDSQCIETVDYDPSWGEAYSYPEPYQSSEQYNAPIRYIDLATADPSLPIAPNFALSELMSLEKGRFALFSPLVVETLQYIRDDLGGPLVVSSAYRNVSYNAGVGGVTYSRHQYGDAVDLQTQMTDLDGLGELCELYVASFVSLYESHVHCDWRDDPLEPAFFDAEYSESSSKSPQIIWTLHGWTTTAGPFTEGEPLRQWSAFDAQGRLISEQHSRYFSIPADTHRVQVTVGGQIRLTESLARP